MSVKQPYLVIIDPQVIFADENSQWASPFFAQAWENIEKLAAKFAGRVVITRWLPNGPRDTSWGAYFQAWPFADVPDTDPVYDLTGAAKKLQRLTNAKVVDEYTFGKWGQALQEIVGAAPELIVTGVATDCCVISTVLPAVDAGAQVTVVTDAVAGSAADSNAAALNVMSLYAPMVNLLTTADILGEQK